MNFVSSCSAEHVDVKQKFHINFQRYKEFCGRFFYKCRFTPESSNHYFLKCFPAKVIARRGLINLMGHFSKSRAIQGVNVTSITNVFLTSLALRSSRSRFDENGRIFESRGSALFTTSFSSRHLRVLTIRYEHAMDTRVKFHEPSSTHPSLLVLFRRSVVHPQTLCPL